MSKHVTSGTNAFRLLATIGLLSLSMAASAASSVGEHNSNLFDDVHKEIVKIKQMPDSHGPVTREQFLEMQGKLFDMAAKDGKMEMPRFKAFLNEFKTFGQ